MNLTNNSAIEQYPSWSPDGSKIAFASDRDGNYEIYVMDVDGSNQTRLTNDSSSDREPAWCGNGKIIFERGTQFYQMDPDGSNYEDFNSFTGSWNSQKNPSCSPDGNSVTYTRNVDGSKLAVFRVASSGGNGSQLIPHSVQSGFSQNADPSYSHDSTKILWKGTSSGLGSGIWIMDQSVGHLSKEFISGDSSYNDPAMSPDGDKIAFYKSNEIWVMDSDGSNPIQLTNTTGNNLAPEWQPSP